MHHFFAQMVLMGPRMLILAFQRFLNLLMIHLHSSLDVTFHLDIILSGSIGFHIYIYIYIYIMERHIKFNYLGVCINFSILIRRSSLKRLTSTETTPFQYSVLLFRAGQSDILPFDNLRKSKSYSSGSGFLFFAVSVIL